MKNTDFRFASERLWKKFCACNSDANLLCKYADLKIKYNELTCTDREIFHVVRGKECRLLGLRTDLHKFWPTCVDILAAASSPQISAKRVWTECSTFFLRATKSRLTFALSLSLSALAGAFSHFYLFIVFNALDGRLLRLVGLISLGLPRSLQAHAPTRNETNHSAFFRLLMKFQSSETKCALCLSELPSGWRRKKRH